MAQTPTAFTCQDGLSYVTRTVGSGNTNTGLYQYNITTGAYTVIAQPLSVSVSTNRVDAIGYNPVDNFLWGSATGTNSVVKIGSNGDTQTFPVIGLPTGNYDAADVDGNGFLYLYASNTGSLYKVDLNASPSPTLAATYTVSPTRTVEDFSVSADGTMLYSISSGNGNLVTFTLSGSTYTTSLTNMGLGSVNYNTFWDDQNNLYAQRRDNGSVYRISSPYSANSAVQVLQGDGNNVFNSDGARCRSAKIQANPTPTVVSCQQGTSYVSKTPTSTNLNTALYAFNQEDGTYTAIAEPILFGSSVNAIGYNPIDNFIWGSVDGSNDLVKVGSNGGTQTFTVAGLPSGTYEAGDIDASGHLYLYSGNGGNIYKINLTSSPLPLLATTFAYAAGSNITDFTVSADGSKINGIIRANGDLATITLSGTNATQTTTALSLPPGNSWNMFKDGGGNLYSQNQTNGNHYLISPPHYNFAQQIETGSANVFNSDGASCTSVSLIDELSPFSCTTYQYQVTANATGGNSTLWQFNPILGTRTSLGVLPGYTNAIGYNPLDNFIWGGTSEGTISKIDAEGNWIQYRIPNLPSSLGYYNVGDISESGYLYIYFKEDTRFYVIDLDASRPTYLQLVDPTIGFALDNSAPFGTAMSPARIISDWAFNPIDGLLYSVLDPSASSPYRLLIMDPLTGISTISSTAISGGGFQQNTDAYGAVFFDGDGNFYAVSNGTGYFYRVNLTTYAATRISTAGVGINFNDGAGCATAPPILTDLGDAPDSYGTFFNSNGPAHIISSNLKIGINVDDELEGQPTSDANGDDLAGTSNDEDGVMTLPDLTTASTTYSLTVKVTNTTGAVATLAGWIDFNGDGTFQNSERTEMPVSDGATSVTLSWSGLSGIVAGNNYIRLRIASDVNEIALPTGAASNGEVEDYKIGVTPLPVKLKSFSVREEANTALLSWSTTEETNVDRFEIEHSTDGREWKLIGEKAATGESKALVSYTFVHRSPQKGINYYRLKMMDRDATYAYSRIRQIDLESSFYLKTYPNPAKTQVFIQAPAGTSITGYQLFNVSGKSILSGSYRHSDGINLRLLPKGIYIIVIATESEFVSQKIVIE